MCAIWAFAMCCAMLRCAMACHAVPGYDMRAMPCYAMLKAIGSRYPVKQAVVRGNKHHITGQRVVLVLVCRLQTSV